ncbi:MAG: hypothetical protein E6H10_07630 [Bacteroidetes bacterium]|nr:MAG: hypothetical protein E6H10_07630 [Bacteroidota bacterium]
MNAASEIKTPIEEAGLTILTTLAYFDIFEYPLSEKEIKSFLGRSIDDATNLVFLLDGYYSLDNNQEKIYRRLEGNERARKLLPKASKIGSFLYKFPYVRAVAISGSLSKNYADKKADIDFFIITQSKRLWIARTILHLFKKTTFLFGRQDYYCMNYFVDGEALTIPERNVYTATEVITLLPAAGSLVMKKFFDANDWSKKWYPTYVPQRSLRVSNKTSAFKKIGEWAFNRSVGNTLDNFLFRWTTRRWKKKEMLKLKNTKGKVMNLVTGKHFSKSDPGAFQEKIVGLYESRIKKIKNQLPNVLAESLSSEKK